MPRLNPLAYVRNGVTAGLSANQAYRDMQGEAGRLTDETGDHWTGVRRDTFLQIWSGVVSVRNTIPEAMNAPKDVPGGGLTIVSRPSSVASGYLYGTVAFTRPIGGSEVERSIHLVRSNDLLTPQQVEDIVRAQIEESAEESHGTFANYTIEGLSFTGVEQLTRTGLP